MFINIKYNLEQKSIEFNSFEEITNYDTVVYINCPFSGLTSLPKLPNSLQKLLCSNNKLTSLPELPNSLKEIYCENNKFIKKLEHNYLKQFIYFWILSLEKIDFVYLLIFF